MRANSFGTRTMRRAALSVRAEARVTHSTRAPPRRGNAEGQFWVDTTCIDCDLCRRMAPSVFKEDAGGSVAYSQPTTREGRVQAMQALLSCPTNSIHAEAMDKTELKAAQQGLPKLIPGCPEIYHCGWHSESSFSAMPFFLRRPGGNVLVDSPRYNPVLAKKLEEMGGVRYMFLTHQDDIADHEKWAKHFGCSRIMHEAEIASATRGVEIQLKGEGPWDIEGRPVSDIPSSSSAAATRDLTILFTPGHTRGHVCLYHTPTKTLFSGDHLCQEDGLPDGSPNGRLHVFTFYNWFSVEEQLRSVRKLKDVDALTLLPGHGHIMKFRDAAHRAEAIDDLLRRHGQEV